MVKSLNIVIPLECYPFDIMFSYNQTDAELLKSMQKYGLGKDRFKSIFNTSDTVKGSFSINESNQSIIRIKKVANKYDIIMFINHEIFHAVTFILDRCGMKLKLLTSDEAYAYLTGYLSKEIYSKLKI